MSTIAQTHRREKSYREAATTTSRFERWAPIGGIAFVVLMVVGSMLVGEVPAPDATRQEIADYLADGGNHNSNIIGAYLWVIGALAFLWFLVDLRSVLRRAEGGTGSLSNLAFGAGVAFVAVWVVAAAAYTAVPYAIEVRDASIVDTDLATLLPALGRWSLLLAGGFAGALVVLAATIATFRTGVFPRWLGWLGIVVSIGLVFDVTYGTIFPLWIWVFVASVVMWMRREEPATTPA